MQSEDSEELILNVPTYNELPEAIANTITDDVNNSGVINEAIYHTAKFAAYPAAELVM